MTDKQSVTYVYGILFTLKKKKEIVTHDTTWINLEDIMVSEISQKQKDKYFMGFPLYEVPKVVKLIEIKCRMVVARGCEQGRIGC
jgi:hypothetical protein